MRNYKKAIMLLLALVVLFAAGVVASADTTSTLTDDFNVYTEITSFKKGYPAGSHTSDILKAKVNSSGNAVTSYCQIEPGKGVDETTALRIYANGSYSDHSYITTKPFDSTTGDTIVLKYDMRIDAHHGSVAGQESSAAGKRTTLVNDLFEMLNDGNTINPTVGGDSGSDFQYEIGKWYNVVIVRDNESISAYIVDGETGLICTYASKSSAGKSNDSVTLFYVPAIIEGNTFDAYIDNMVMSTYNPEMQAPSVTDINIEDGKTDVLLNTEINVEFDQLFLDGTPEPVVLAGDTPVNTTVQKMSTSKIKITFNTLLERNTEYTISFDEVTNGTLACNSGDVTFTTEDLHLWNDVEIAPVEAGPVTDLELTIGEEYGYPTYTGKALVMVYRDGVMTSIVPLALNAEDITSALYKDVPLGILESGDEIKVVLVDDVNGIVPLALGSTTVQ